MYTVWAGRRGYKRSGMYGESRQLRAAHLCPPPYRPPPTHRHTTVADTTHKRALIHRPSPFRRRRPPHATRHGAHYIYSIHTAAGTTATAAADVVTATALYTIYTARATSVAAAHIARRATPNSRDAISRLSPNRSSTGRRRATDTHSRPAHIYISI